MAVKRINLLPPEIAVRRRVQRQTFGLGTGFLVLLLILGAIWVFRQGQLHDQEDRKAVAEAEARSLQNKVDALAEFSELDKTVKDKKATLAASMAGDVAWSRLMVELSMIIPGDSWLLSMNGTSAPPTAPAAGAAPAPAGAQAASLGTLNFTAVTFDFPGVAKWITRLQELPSLQTIWVPSASTALIGERDVVNYSSTAELSSDSASGRYQPAAAR